MGGIVRQLAIVEVDDKHMKFNYCGKIDEY